MESRIILKCRKCGVAWDVDSVEYSKLPQVKQHLFRCTDCDIKLEMDALYKGEYPFSLKAPTFLNASEDTISGIWEDNYVQRLGILNHCKEILTIDEEIMRKKNNDVDVSCLENSFNKELMDLKLILDKYFENGTDLKDERLDKFRSKSKGM